jgi:hypothetical protein
MKNKILLLSFILTLSSCSMVQKTQTISQDVESPASVTEDSNTKRSESTRQNSSHGMSSRMPSSA